VVLGKQDAFTAIGQGVRLARASLLDTGITWLILVGVGILWGILMIPVVLILLAFIGAIGLIPAGLVYAVSQSWIVAAIVGGAIFIIVLAPVMSFVQGLYEVYTSGVWTLAYREVASKHSALFSAAPASA
jgi:fumarate reductase subunit D